MRNPVSFSYDQPCLWQQIHRKPHSPPAGSRWGFLHILHSWPALAAAWSTWTWHLGRQTSPAAGRRKLARPVKGKATYFWEAPCRSIQRFRIWHVSHWYIKSHSNIRGFCWEYGATLSRLTHPSEALASVQQCNTEGRTGHVYSLPSLSVPAREHNNGK